MSGLERARSVVESRFLEAGDVLGQAVTGIGQLISALDQLTAALSPETVDATVSELNTAAQTLFGLREGHEERRRRIRDLSRVGESLGGGIEDMRRDLAYLRVFAINIKVTAAGVPDAGEDFALFAQEISDRIEAGRQELEGFSGGVLALRDQLAETLAQELALAGQCERLIPAVPDGLAAGAEEMAAHHMKVAEAAEGVAGLARDIQRKVGSALAALQVGDSTRQRIEHVQQGLALAEAAALPPLPKRRVEAIIRRLMAAQLAAAAADFHRDAAQIRQNLSGMARDAEELLRLRELAFGRSTAGEGFLERMTRHLGEALELVTRMEAADLATASAGAAAADSVAALNQRIAVLQSIKTDVQQMALNTTLKCARIGELGKPLAVIAIELRAHAGNLEGLAKTALATLDTLAVEAAGLIGDAAGADAGAALTAATARLRGASDAVEADLCELARQGEAVVRALAEAAARLDLDREIGAVLDAAATALAEQAQDAPPECDEAADALASLLQQIAKSYTMAQEREVHAAVAAEYAPAPTALPVAAPAGADEFEDVLF